MSALVAFVLKAGSSSARRAGHPYRSVHSISSLDSLTDGSLDDADDDGHLDVETKSAVHTTTTSKSHSRRRRRDESARKWPVALLLTLGGLVAGYSVCSFSSSRQPPSSLHATSASVSNEPAESERFALADRLAWELARIEQKYALSPHDARYVQNVSRPHLNQNRSLAVRLTRAYFGLQPSFLVGVTGGSSTQGRESWPTLLEQYLRERLNVTTAVVRNAAHGKTSQLVTAPCVQALIGDKRVVGDDFAAPVNDDTAPDLLAWEFGMNDEGYIFNSWFQDKVKQERLHRRVAEVWVRGALQSEPAAIGFLHLWDLFVHKWNWDDKRADKWLPDRPWQPTNDVMREYSSVVDAFSVNALHFLRDGAAPSLVSSKSKMLRDAHHPSSASTEVATDLFVYAMVSQWHDYLSRPVASLPPQRPPIEDRLAQVVPMYTEWQLPVDLPSHTLRSACLSSPPPNFAVHNPMSAVCYHYPTGTGQEEEREVEWMSRAADDAMPLNCTGWSRVKGGKVDPNRTDRVVDFVPGLCPPEPEPVDIGTMNANGTSPDDAASLSKRQVTTTTTTTTTQRGERTGLDIRVRKIDNWKYLMLDCGSLDMDSCGLLRVAVNGRVVAPTISLTKPSPWDIWAEFYTWVHEFTPFLPGHRRHEGDQVGGDAVMGGGSVGGEDGYDTINLCLPREHEAREKWPAVQRVVIWHEPSSP